jgi:S-adenosylmethionine synthetase
LELRALLNDAITFHINPTGKFVIGNPHSDTSLPGRKIIVDANSGKSVH